MRAISPHTHFPAALRIAAAALLLLSAAIGLSACGGGGPARITDPEDLRYIVAEADGGKFTMTQAMLTSAIARRLNAAKRNLASVKPEERPFLNRLAIEEAVFIHELTKMMATVQLPDLDERVKEEVDNFTRQFSSEAEIDAQLAKAGMTMEKYRNLVREKIIRQAAIQKNLKPYVPTEEEIDEYYTVHNKDFIAPAAYRFSQILFRVQKPPAGASDEKKAEIATHREELKKLAETVREKLVQGADFATLAREQSDDISSRDKGGDCGYIIERTELPEVYQVVSTAKLNELSPIFESEYGFHIIKVTEIVPEGVATRASARPAIVKILQELHKKHASQKFVKQVLTDAKIVYHIPIAQKPPASATPAPTAAGPKAPGTAPAPLP